MASRTHRAACVADLAGSIAACVLLGAFGCDDPNDPLPQPFPPNIHISTEPAPGATVEAATTSGITMSFDQPMDPASLRLVRRMSFLLPVSLADLQGRWNAEHTRVVFEMTQFPVQPGALYEAVFSGLRTASGDLYNLGPYRVHFRTRGTPDLLPRQMPEGLTEREFCRDSTPEATTCDVQATLRVAMAGVDSLWLRWSCPTCDVPETGELFRRGRVLEWLGFETGAAEGRRSVLWSEPVPLCSVPAVRGKRTVAASRTAPDGTRLENWECVVASPDSPVHTLRAGALAVSLVFSESTVLDIQYTLVPSGRSPARHRERWWLYPGIGLVRRERRIQIDDSSSFERWRFAPGLPQASAAP